MPPELQPYAWLLPPLLSGLGCLFAGWLLTFLILSPRRVRLEERLKSAERQAADLEARLAASSSHADETERYAQALRSQVVEFSTRLEAEIQSSIDKQALLERTEQRLSDSFKALSVDALRSSSEQFLQLARTSLKSQSDAAHGELQQRQMAIEHVVRPLAESLGRFENRVSEIEKERVGAYAELQTQVKALAEGQLGLQRETAQLVKALRQPTGRGQWGEIQLRRVVELAGMQERCDFVMQHSVTDGDGARLRPDLVVHLPGGKTIVVDAKTPMDGYLDALEASDERLREEALLRHARQVRTHIAQLGSKNYASQFEHSPEFTVLFLPSESFFSAALGCDPALIEQGVEKGVILATPTTLIALLRAVAYGWRQEKLADNAREIAQLGRTMHERLGVLTGHFAKLGRSLEMALGHYNATVSSYETRVLTAARKFEELEAAGPGQELPELPLLDGTVRRPMALLEGEIPD